MEQVLGLLALVFVFLVLVALFLGPAARKGKLRKASTADLLKSLASSRDAKKHVLDELATRTKEAKGIGDGLLEQFLKGDIPGDRLLKTFVALGPDAFRSIERRSRRLTKTEGEALLDFFSEFQELSDSQGQGRILREFVPSLVVSLLSVGKSSLAASILSEVGSHIDGENRERIDMRMLESLSSAGEEEAGEVLFALEEAPLSDRVVSHCLSLYEGSTFIGKERLLSLLVFYAEEGSDLAKNFLQTTLGPELLRVLSSKADDHVREAAILLAILGEFAPPSTETALRDLLVNASDSVFPALLAALGNVVESDASFEGLMSSFLGQLCKIGEQSSGTLSSDILEALSVFGPSSASALPLVRKFLASNDQKVRRACAYVLHNFGSPEALGLLKELAQDADPVVSAEAQLWLDQ
jgi:HEAT repeat protein